MPDLDERLEELIGQLAEPVETESTLERVRGRMIPRWRQRRFKIATGLVAAAACVAFVATQVVTLGGSGARRLRTTGHGNPPAVSAPPSVVTIPSPTTAPPPATVFQFHQDTDSCTPELTPPIKRTWQVSAPRTPQAAAASVQIGLRNKMAGSMGDRGPIDPQILLPAPDIALQAQVRTPNGATYTSSPLRLRPTPPDSWVFLSYPTDFAHAPDLTTGPYTILWVTPLGPVACDGFAIS